MFSGWPKILILNLSRPLTERWQKNIIPTAQADQPSDFAK
jgi:hypothetical protein